MRVKVRCVCRMDAVLLESAGVKTPCSRNCLMLDMRRREEADGERRIIGSSRRVEGFLRLETRAEFVEREDVVGAALRERDFPRYMSHCLRTWEKSVGLMPRNMVLRSPIIRSPL